MNAPIIVSIDTAHNNGQLPVKQLSVSAAPNRTIEVFRAMLPAVAGYPSLHDIDLALLVEGFLAGCSVDAPAIIRNEEAWNEWPATIVASGAEHNDGINYILTVTSHNNRCEVHVANLGDRVWFTITLSTPSNRHVVNFMAAYQSVAALVEHAVTVQEAPKDPDKLPEVGDTESLVILWQTPYLKVSKGDDCVVARCWKDLMVGHVLFDCNHSLLNPFYGPKAPFTYKLNQLAITPEAAEVARDECDTMNDEAYGASLTHRLGVAEENYAVLKRCGVL